MERLNLAYDCLGELTFNSSALSRLETVNISNNNIQVIHESFGSLPRISRLEAKRNKLSKLPMFSRGPTYLQYLDISDNLLEEFLPSICSASSLKTLKISDNLISSIPDEIWIPNFTSPPRFGQNFFARARSTGGLQKL